VKAQQNKRYRLKHHDREQERKQHWRLEHGEEYQKQRERERARSALNRPWGRQRLRQLPTALAVLRRSILGPSTSGR
jgi:hypothetical protein